MTTTQLENKLTKIMKTHPKFKKLSTSCGNCWETEFNGFFVQLSDEFDHLQIIDGDTSEVECLRVGEDCELTFDGGCNLTETWTGSQWGDLIAAIRDCKGSDDD